MKHLVSIVLLLAISVATVIADQGRRPLFAGVSYAPSHANADTAEAYASEDRIRSDLQILSKVTSRVRTYSIENGMSHVPAIAASLGMKVSIGIWLGPDQAANQKQVEAAIRLIQADHGAIDRVFVGNETLLRGDLNLEELRDYLRQVKHGAGERPIEVTTGETWGYWLKYPDLASDCDVIGAHIIPYWDGYVLKDAVQDVVDQLTTLKQAFPGTPIVIGETGWPSRGQTHEGAVPSPEGQTQFLSELLSNPATKNADYYIVEAFDQPWKASSEGEVGPGWGIFNSSGVAKVDFAKLFPMVTSAD
jgi:exo-beta-1,3-glucanase (GH17 family)